MLSWVLSWRLGLRVCGRGLENWARMLDGGDDV